MSELSSKYQKEIKRNNSSSFVRNSEIESSKKSQNSNDKSNSNEESKSNNLENESEEKISLNPDNNKENNENSNFSRIEEEESSDNSHENESDEFTNNFKWSKKFKNQIFERFKRMVRTVHQKKRIDYNSIILAIQEDEDEKILEVLTDNDFKTFYRNKDNLFEKDVFMDEMIKYKKFFLLKKVIEDPAYEFDKDYIFNCLYFCINPKIFDEKNNNVNKAKRNIICFTFNYDFFNNTSTHIVESIDKYLKTKPKKSFKNINDITMLEIIEGLVENHLYDDSSYKKLRIILWFMTLLGLNDSFTVIIKDNEKIFFNALKKEENDLHDLDDSTSLSKIFNDIMNKKEIEAKELDLYTIKYYLKTIEDCLSCDLEDLAILLANLRKPYPELIATYKIAVKFENMMYLKFIWEKTINHNKKLLKEFEPKLGIINRAKYRNSRNSIKNIMFNIDISEIINILIKNHKEEKNSNELYYKIRKIFEWKNIEQEASLLKCLFDNNFFQHICYFLKHWPPDKINKEEYFKKAIEFKQKELILFYLNKPEIRNILYNKKIQKIIVNEYIPNGELFYYGAECLSYIYKKKWDINLTKNLCNNITKIIKTKDILNCHSPILTCLLLVEFIKHIRYLSSSDIKKCTKVLELLIDFCQRVQESIHDEASISYLMKQKDTRERTVFQIVSDDRIYELLETAEIGTVIKKMRDGVLNANGIRNTSALHRFLFENTKLANPFNAFQKINPNKVYFFQLNARLDGCDSRINETGIFSIALALVYQFYIYFLNENEEVLNNFEEISKESRIFY